VNRHPNPNVADHGLERAVLATSAWWGGAAARFLTELRPRDFDHPAHRRMFANMADAHRRGMLVERAVIDGLEIRTHWLGLSDRDSDGLAEIIRTSAQLYRFDAAIAHLQRLTKRRGLVALAEGILAGEQAPDPLLEWLLDESAVA
jgi:replicative DNA helicase